MDRVAEESGSRKTNVNLALTGEDQLIVLPLLLVLLNIEVSHSLICTWTSSASVWLQSLQTHITKTRCVAGGCPVASNQEMTSCFKSCLGADCPSRPPVKQSTEMRCTDCMSVWLAKKLADVDVFYIPLQKFMQNHWNSWHTLLKPVRIQAGYFKSSVENQVISCVQEEAKPMYRSRHLHRLPKKNLKSCEIHACELVDCGEPFLQFCSECTWETARCL